MGLQTPQVCALSLYVLEATSLIAIVCSLVERTASWSMLDLPPWTVKSSRGTCQITSSSAG